MDSFISSAPQMKMNEFKKLTLLLHYTGNNTHTKSIVQKGHTNVNTCIHLLSTLIWQYFKSFVSLFYQLTLLLYSPVEKKFQMTSRGQDPVEQMQRGPGRGAALGFDLDVASYISPRLSIQRQRKSNRVSFTPGLASQDCTQHTALWARHHALCVGMNQTACNSQGMALYQYWFNQRCSTKKKVLSFG